MDWRENMTELLTSQEAFVIVTMMAMPESKMKLVCLEGMKEKYKGHYPLCAYKETEIDNMIDDLKKKYAV